MDNVCTGGLSKQVLWHLQYYPSHPKDINTDVVPGDCSPGGTQCWPAFYQEVFEDGNSPYDASFVQIQHTAYWENGSCHYLAEAPHQSSDSYICCTAPSSPVLVDINGDGFVLTNAANGIAFDFFGNGIQKQLA